MAQVTTAPNPYSMYKQLRDEDPVHWDEASGQYWVLRYRDIESVLVDHKRFSNILPEILDGRAPRFGPLREEDQPRHTFLRQIIMPLFTPAAMRKREASFRAIAVDMLDEAERHDVIDATEALAIPLPGRVVLDILGLPLSSHEPFLALTAERLKIMATRLIPPPGTRSWDEVQSDLWNVARPVAEARRKQPENDGIGVLIAAQDQYGKEEISDDLIIDMLLHVLTAGFHTTQHLIELLVDLFADRPDLWQRLRDDRSLIGPAIEEMLRWEAPVQSLPRRTVEEVEIAGVTLPENTVLSAVFGSGNRDERVFEDPDEFSLDRQQHRHFAFSLGIHYCPGAPVSRSEVTALLEEMLDRYAVIERAAESEPYVDEGSMRGWKKVPVRLKR